MELHFLGTGAANWPNPGPKVGQGRRFSSLLLNQVILIDCGPMALDAMAEFAVNVNLITAVFIGHPHGDHFNLNTLLELARRRQDGLPPLQVYVAKKTCESCKVPEELASRITFIGFAPGNKLEHNGYTVQAHPANHLVAPGVPAAHFIITTPDQKVLFYGLDGAWLPPTTWAAVQKNKFDAMVFELTCGPRDDWRLGVHSNLAMLKIMKSAFTNDGAITSSTKLFCSHIARGLCPPHDQYAPQIAQDGFILAHDGLKWQC